MRQLLESWNEYINVEQSINEIGQCHDPSTGHFDKCTKGNVYSVSKRGAKAGNLDPKYVARGKLTQDKPEETESADDYKMKSPFGLNHGKKQGGRIKPQGGKHSPVRSVANYPDKYRRAGKDENQGRGDDSSDLELLEMDKDGNESERERHERLFPGSDSMARLANGIMGESENTEAESAYLKALVTQEFKTLQQQLAKIMQSNARAKGQCSLPQALEIIRAIEQAQSGK